MPDQKWHPQRFKVESPKLAKVTRIASISDAEFRRKQRISARRAAAQKVRQVASELIDAADRGVVRNLNRQYRELRLAGKIAQDTNYHVWVADQLRKNTDEV